MTQSPPPRIFSPQRRLAVRARSLAAASKPDAARYLADDMAEDIVERLGFMRVTPQNSLVIGDLTGGVSEWLVHQGAEVTRCDIVGSASASRIDLESPLPFAGFDFVACLGLLDTVNDLPGALIHLRNAARPGGLLIASFVGAGSLPALREAMLAADGERPGPRLHPAIDVRAGGQLLQRAGWADPVVDSRSLEVRFSSFERLRQDLHDQGLGNVLSDPGLALSRRQVSVLKERFAPGTVERFEILTLTGRRP